MSLLGVLIFTLFVLNSNPTSQGEFLLILLYHDGHTNLSTVSDFVSVCPGGQLTLNCDTNSSVIHLVCRVMFNSPSSQHTETQSVFSIGSAESQTP